MEGLGIGGGILGSAFGALGSLSSGYSEASNLSYEEQVAYNNAQIARQNAVWATEIGETRATNEGLKTRAIVGAEKAAQAASGIDVNTGSAPDVRASTAEIGELDALTIRSNAARQAYGYDVAAVNDVAQARLLSAESAQARRAGIFGAVGSLLGGASSAGSQYAQWQNVNPVGSGAGGTMPPIGGAYGGTAFGVPGGGYGGFPGGGIWPA